MGFVALLGMLTKGGGYAASFIAFCFCWTTTVVFLIFGVKYKNAIAAITPNPAATKILDFNNNYKNKRIKRLNDAGHWEAV